MGYRKDDRVSDGIGEKVCDNQLDDFQVCVCWGGGMDVTEEHLGRETSKNFSLRHGV